VVLRGKVKESDQPRLLYRSIAGAERYAGEIFAQLLRQTGITFSGAVIVESAPLPAEDLFLLELPGETLRNTLGLMLDHSNNIIADTLALNLLVAYRQEQAEEGASAPPAQQVALQLPQAGLLLQGFLRDAVAASRFSGDQASQSRLFDGSGLTPENRLSSRDLVGLLDSLYRKPADFSVLFGNLVIPDEKNKHAALWRENRKWQTRLAVKTGGLTEPISVITIAGYLRFDDDRWGAFAMMVNGEPGKSINRWEAFAAMEESLDPAFSLARGVVSPPE
jgi:D-alanyl-D-alanine carboxypeptidase/D-alanyl-D-alanine-endopeptidase (penicillin-binding protein 4)